MRKLAQLKLHDSDGIALANQSDIQVAWFDQPEPKDFSAIAYKTGTETTDEDGNMVIDIDGGTSLGENDPGFLLAYQLNPSDHHNSLVFAGKLNVSLGILNGADLFLPGDLGFWHWPQDLSSMRQDSAGTIAAVLGQPVGKVLDKTSIGYNATQATTSLKPILKRMPTSGIRNLLANSDDVVTGGDWSLSGAWSPVEAASYNSGGKSWLVTNDGVLSSRNLAKSLGVSGGEFDCISFIFELPALNAALTSAVSIYDNTASSFVARATLTWATESIGMQSGDGGGEKLASVGPNGGPVFRVWCAGAAQAGNIHSRFVYPTGTNTNTNSIIIHAAQLETASSVTGHQITVGGYDVFEEGFNQVYWLDYEVDDKLISSNADLGTNATRIRLNTTGVTIEEGLTLGANLELSTDNLGLIVINRALSAAEKSAITAYLNKFVGL